MAALYKTITLCTPPIIDIGIIQHRAARYNIYTGETILPPSPLVLVVIEADTTNLSKCPHNLAPIKIQILKADQCVPKTCVFYFVYISFTADSVTVVVT